MRPFFYEKWKKKKKNSRTRKRDTAKCSNCSKCWDDRHVPPTRQEYPVLISCSRYELAVSLVPHLHMFRRPNRNHFPGLRLSVLNIKQANCKRSLHRGPSFSSPGLSNLGPIFSPAKHSSNPRLFSRLSAPMKGLGCQWSRVWLGWSWREELFSVDVDRLPGFERETCWFQLISAPYLCCFPSF